MQLTLLLTGDLRATLTADFAAFPDTQGAAVVGVFRNHGTEPAFDVPSYPEDEVCCSCARTRLD